MAGEPPDSVILRPPAGDDGLRWEAGQHIRWELNDLARRLNEQPAAVGLPEGLVPAPATSGSGLSPDGRRMLRAIGALPDEGREVFDLVRIQGMTQAEAAEVLGVSPETFNRHCCCRRSAAAGSRCAPSRRTSMRRLPPGS
jgi:hypothetical protein